jgi:hypothetical protein
LPGVSVDADRFGVDQLRAREQRQPTQVDVTLFRR